MGLPPLWLSVSPVLLAVPAGEAPHQQRSVEGRRAVERLHAFPVHSLEGDLGSPHAGARGASGAPATPGGGGSGGCRGGQRLLGGAGGRIGTAADHIFIFRLFLWGSLSLRFEAED